MIVTTFFTLNGSPATGLSPTIRIRNSANGDLVVTDASMYEIGDGFYGYDFTTYVATTDYVFRMYGGSSLPAGEQYAVAGNESYTDDIASAVWSATIDGRTTPLTYGEALDVIHKVETGRWQILGTQMIFYDENGTTPLLTFDLDSPTSPTERTPA